MGTIRGTHMYYFQQKLKHLKQCIKQWNKELFGNIFQAQQDLETQVREIQ